MFWNFFVMFMIVRLLFIFSLIFNASHATETGHALKPSVTRLFSTQIFSQNKPSVAIMGKHFHYKEEPHHRIDDRTPSNPGWTPIRASATIMLNFDENSLTTRPVPAYRISNKYCLFYEQGQAPQIIQLPPFGNELVKQGFKSFQENKNNIEDIKRMNRAHIENNIHCLDYLKFLESYDVERDMSIFEKHAQTQLQGICFIDNITLLKTVPGFNTEDQHRFSSLPRPIIPNISFIKSPGNILQMAKFHKDFYNYMIYHFCLTQEVIPLGLQDFMNALETEPSRLLYIIRPDPSHKYYIPGRVNRLKAYSLLREKIDDLLYDLPGEQRYFNLDKIKENWKTDFEAESKVWFSENEDLFHAFFTFAEMIWCKPLPELLYPLSPSGPTELYRRGHPYKEYMTGFAQPYMCPEDFERDLAMVDPDFIQVIEQNKEIISAQGELG